MAQDCIYPPSSEQDAKGFYVFVCVGCGHVRRWSVNDTSKLPKRNCKQPAQRVEQPKPPLPLRLFNYVKAQTLHWMAGRPKCTQEQIEQRLAICKRCPHYQNNACTQCGCNCNLEPSSWFNKLVMADQSCPLPEPLWERVDGY